MAIKPKLYVEGVDDLHTTIHLLQRHGVNMGTKPVEIFTSGGDDGLLSDMASLTRLASDYPIGFVLDMDTKAEDRWKSVTERLEGRRVKSATRLSSRRIPREAARVCPSSWGMADA